MSDVFLSVDDCGLPPPFKRVLVWRNDGIAHNLVQSAFVYKETSRKGKVSYYWILADEYNSNRRINDVTHWMPHPTAEKP